MYVYLVILVTSYCDRQRGIFSNRESARRRAKELCQEHINEWHRDDAPHYKEINETDGAFEFKDHTYIFKKVLVND